MATLSTVAVDFIANTAKYIAGLAKVNSETKKFSNESQKEFDKVKKSSNNLGSGFSKLSSQFSQLRNVVAGTIFASFVKDIANAAGRIGDLSDQLGVTTDDVQRLETIFTKNGAAVEDLTGLVVKLQKGASEASGGSKQLADAFTRLGINYQTFANLNPTEQIELFAQSLGAIQNPAQRAVAAQEILGKSSAKLLNSLNEIATKGSINAATDGIVLASGEAVKAVKTLEDEGKSALLSVQRTAIEIVGALAKANSDLQELQKKGPGGVPTTAASFLGMGGLGTRNALATIAAAAAEETSRLAEEQQRAKIAADQLAAKNRELALDIERSRVFTKAFNEEIAKTAKQVQDATQDPFDKAQEEINQLADALYYGYITQDQFNKRLKEIKSSVDSITSAMLSLNEEMTVNNELTYAQIAARQELFGQGTLPTIGLPKGMSRFETTPAEEFTKKESQRLQSLSEQIRNDAMSAEEVYRQRVIDINTAAAATDDYGRKLLTVEQQTYALSEAQKQLQQATLDVWEKANPQIMQAFEFMNGFADSFARAIVEGQNFGDALKNVFKSILRDITTLILRTAILQAIMASIGLVNPVAAASFGQLTGLIPRAEGGPVMAGEAYRVGESGPETFIPASNGYILPNELRGGGEQVIVNQTINIQTGVAQTVRAEMIGLLPRFKQEAMAGVLDAKQRGGSYAKGLAAA
jgi:hypothetical protein